MPEALSAALVPGNLPTFAFVLTRVGGMTSTAPMWTMSGVPRQVRAAVAVLLSLMLFPLAPRVQVPELLAVLPVGLALEFLIGVVIGLTAAVFVHAVTLAGEVLALQTGLSLGSAVSPLSDALVPGVGQLKSFMALMIYLGLDGHLALLRGLADSMAALPPGGGFSFDAVPGLAVHFLGTVYTSALMAAAPAIVALLLVNVAIGITSRVVPQLQAILVLFPVSIGIGLLMVGIALPTVASVVAGWMNGLPEQIAEVLGALRGAP
jgi:flagellar biosynthetic protein FliR